MPMTRPNILFFMSDNQPADLLGCSGNDEVRTPHIDQLAERGNPVHKRILRERHVLALPRFGSDRTDAQPARNP